MTGRILCLDPGLRQIGLALSDELGVTVREYGTYANNRDFWPTLKKICDAEQIQLIVVGKPVAVDGGDSPGSAWFDSFVERLGRETEIAVKFEAETGTSKEAATKLSGGGSRGGDRIHATAAKVILEGYLASHQ